MLEIPVILFGNSPGKKTTPLKQRFHLSILDDVATLGNVDTIQELHGISLVTNGNGATGSLLTLRISLFLTLQICWRFL